MTMTRKMLAALAVGVLVVAACGDDDDDDDAGPTPTEEAGAPDTAGGTTGDTTGDTGGGEAAAGEPQPGGTIVIGVDAETDRFDPGNGNSTHRM